MPETDFGRNLRHYRTRRGLTQQQLADAAGVTANTAARWERGEILPPWPTICILADVLGVSVARFRSAD